MLKKILTILVIIIIGGGGYYLYQKTLSVDDLNPDFDLEQLKASITTDPIVSASNLTEEQIASFLNDYKAGKDAVLVSDFDSLSGLNDVALAKQHLGDYDGAIAAWEYANYIRPQNSLSFANLAALYHFEVKDLVKAEKNYLIALANDPDDLPTIRNLFELYLYSIKDYKKAQGLMLDSIKHNPNSDTLLVLLARAYQADGQLQNALENYEKYLQKKPNSQEIIKEVEVIKQQL